MLLGLTSPWLMMAEFRSTKASQIAGKGLRTRVFSEAVPVLP
jgi:hypothetical protein